MAKRSAARTLVALCLLALAAPARGATLTLVTKDALTDPTTQNTLDNSASVTLPATLSSRFLPLQGQSDSSNGGNANASASGSANFGLLTAKASQSRTGASPYRESAAEAEAAFKDSVTISGGSGTGSYQALFKLDGVANALLSSFTDDPATMDPSFAHANYTATITLGSTVLEWTGQFISSSISGNSSVLASTLKLNGAVVADTLPDGLPGTFTTPTVSFLYGTPFELSARLKVSATGDDNDTSRFSASADLSGTFQWLGMTGLAPGDVVTSQSGASWAAAMVIPEPGTLALLSAGLIGLAVFPRVSHSAGNA
jgi:hypothetical protein